MADSSTITEGDVAAVLDQQEDRPAGPRTLEELKEAKKKARERAVEQIERTFILDALTRNDWNISRASREVGIQRSNLHALMRKYGIKQRPGDK